MQKLLDEIFSVPGVTASCVFDKSRGMVHLNPENGVAGYINDSVGNHFARLLQMSVKSNLQVKTAQFRFDKYWLVGIPLREGLVLFVFCDLQASCSLVASAALLLVEEMFDSSSLVEEALEETVQVDEYDVESADVPESEFNGCFDEIEAALANAIGPVAKVVMSDSVSKWKKKGRPSVQRLPELLGMLADEIGDPVLVAEFKSLLSHLD